MTPTFQRQMRRMAGLKFAPTDLSTHWEGLRDVNPELLAQAVAIAIKECEAFPSPSEVLSIVTRIQPIISIRKPDREWKYFCERCSDTGWESMYCAGDAIYATVVKCEPKPWWIPMRCERITDHYAHEWSRHCVCWESNPDVLKKRAAAAQQAARRTAKDTR